MITKEKLKQLFCEEYYNYQKLSDYFSVSKTTIWRKIKEFGLKRNNKNVCLEKIKIDKNKLLKLYRKNISLTKIGEIFNCSKITIHRRLNKLNIKPRAIDNILISKWTEERKKMIKRDLSGKLLKSNDFPLNYEYSDKFSVIKRTKSIKGDKCEICGWDKSSVDGHHKLSTKDGGKHILDNIVLVCPNCHRLIHRGIIKL